MMKLKTKTEEDRINEDSLWLGRNTPSLILGSLTGGMKI